MSRADRQRARRELGLGAVLSVSEAATLLPWGDGVSRAWLRREGLVSVGPDGREAVVWRRVVEHLEGGPHADREEPAPTVRLLPREPL